MSFNVRANVYGLARNHGSFDVKKLTAWIAARIFLADQSLTLIFEKIEAVSIMKWVAAGTVMEAELAARFRQRLR